MSLFTHFLIQQVSWKCFYLCYISLVTAATRMLKGDFFHWKQSVVFLCVLHSLIFWFSFLRLGWVSPQAKMKSIMLAFSKPNALRVSFPELLQKYVYYFTRQKQRCYHLVLMQNCLSESEHRDAPQIITWNSHFKLFLNTVVTHP